LDADFLLLRLKDSEGPRFAQIEGSAHQSTLRCNGQPVALAVESFLSNYTPLARWP